MKAVELLAAAKAAPEKLNVEEYREVVLVLREKGYTWREVAEFLSERGVAIDHTRLFRHFGSRNEEGRSEFREIEVGKVTFVGEKKKGNRTTWHVMEMELPSKLGLMLVKGFTCHAGSPNYQQNADGALLLRKPRLNLRAKNKGFPVACVTADLKLDNGEWRTHDVYIAPKWEELL